MPAFQILQLGSLVFDQFYFVSVADECDIWVVGDGAAEFVDETGIHVFAFAEAYLASTALRQHRVGRRREGDLPVGQFFHLLAQVWWCPSPGLLKALPSSECFQLPQML